MHLILKDTVTYGQFGVNEIIWNKYIKDKQLKIIAKEGSFYLAEIALNDYYRVHVDLVEKVL